MSINIGFFFCKMPHFPLIYERYLEFKSKYPITSTAHLQSKDIVTSSNKLQHLPYLWSRKVLNCSFKPWLDICNAREYFTRYSVYLCLTDQQPEGRMEKHLSNSTSKVCLNILTLAGEGRIPWTYIAAWRHL